MVDINWADFQNEMGYDDEELAIFRANKKAMRLLLQVDEMAAWDIIAEVMEAPGCANHKLAIRSSCHPWACCEPAKART